MKKLLIVCVIIAVVGGLGFMITQSQGKFDHHGVLEEIHHNEYNSHSDQNVGNESYTSRNNDMDTSEFLKVHAQNPDIKSFFTQFRTEEIISFPCQSCHNVPLSKIKSDDVDGRKAHWDITVNHAEKSVMNCMTCHHEDNMDYLNSLSGEPISIDRSFELCGQCHSTQYKDWQGGAHGKSLSGWKPPRIIKTCVNCHNPHAPAIESRWPSRLVDQNKMNLK